MCIILYIHQAYQACQGYLKYTYLCHFAEHNSKHLTKETN